MAAVVSRTMQIVNVYRWMWHWSGIWSGQDVHDDSAIYQLYSLLMFASTSILFNGFMLLSLMEDHSVNAVVACLLPATTTVLTSVKIAIFWANRGKWKRLFASFAHLDSQLDIQSVGFNEAMGRALATNRRLLFVISCSSYSAITLAFLNARLSDGRGLMWPSWFPVPWQTDDDWYMAVLVFQYVCNMYIGFVYNSMTIVGPCLYRILSGYLEILGERLKAIGENGNDDDDFAFRSRDEQELRKCVDFHKDCRRMADLMNEIFEIHYTVQFSFSGLVICVTAFQLSVSNSLDNLTEFLFNCEYMFCMSFEIFLPCYYGSFASYQSAQLCTDLYSAVWTQQSKAFKVAMNIFTQNAQRTIRFVTYKRWFFIELPTFVMVLRFAYSMLSFLKAI